MSLAVVVSPLPAQRASASPTVLTDDCISRLAILNAAVRRLREMGLTVLSQQLEGDAPANGTPLVWIARAPMTSIAALLDATPPRSYWPPAPLGQHRTRIASTRLDGVVVAWKEL